MNGKTFEIRDRATFIAVMAIEMAAEPTDSQRDGYLLRRAGYSPFGQPLIMLVKLDGGYANYDPYGWGNSSRTMSEAHKYITDNWADLESGQVIDVEYILGETGKPKVSEMVTYPL